MPARMPILRPAILLLLVSGCVQYVENRLPDEYLVFDPKLAGKWVGLDWEDKPNGIFEITASNEQFQLHVKNADTGETISWPLYLYRIGDEHYLQFPNQPDSGEPPEWHLLKVIITEEELMVWILSDEFFKKNPQALPGTYVKLSDPKSGKVISVGIRSSGSQLADFLRLHSGNQELFEKAGSRLVREAAPEKSGGTGTQEPSNGLFRDGALLVFGGLIVAGLFGAFHLGRRSQVQD